MTFPQEVSFAAALAGGALVAFRRRTTRSGAGASLDPDEPGTYPLILSSLPREIRISEKMRLQHLEIAGSPGTGKNYHCLLPMLYQDIVRGAALIIVDPKGSMRRTIEAYARMAGRSGDLRCLDLSDPAGSDSYNPFVGDDPALVAERVHEAFYADDATATSFYRDTALGFLQGFFGLCRRLDALPTPQQLRRVALDQQALATMIALAPRSPEARDLRRGALRQSPLEYARNLQGLVNALGPLTSGPFAGLFNTTRPSLDLGAALEGGGIVYAGLASDQYPTAFKRVGTLLLMDLQASLTKRYLTQSPAAFVYLDEFADLLYPQARALIAKAREARVGITLAHQSLGDLTRLGQGVADGIFEATANKIILRQGGAASALAFARLSGSLPAGERVSHSVNRWGLRGERMAKTLSPSGSPAYVFDPDALLNLAVGEAFIIVQNSRGRELYRTHLPTAPEPEAAPPGAAPAPAEGIAHRSLVLGEDQDPPGPQPTTPLGQAALLRMRRSRKRGP